jgi:FHS family L-fucose permease-like MFS transporter
MPKLQGMIIDIGGYAVNDVSIVGISEINLSFLLPVLCFAFHNLWA